MKTEQQPFLSPAVAKHKAVALLSGGLDSTLAIKLMLEQGIDILAVELCQPVLYVQSEERSKLS